MFYTIYKITNRVNGKVYIGKHQTNDIADGYMGSGKLIRQAIEKYGSENFEKEILFEFSTEEEMNSKEAELVTEEFCNREDTYNLCPGGHGGFGYINTSGIGLAKRDYKLIGKKVSEKLTGRKNPNASKTLLKMHKEGKIKIPDWTGRTHKEKTKNKISSSKRGTCTGEKNSQFGSIWITNGVESIKIDKGETIPTGWVKGRRMNNKETTCDVCNKVIMCGNRKTCSVECLSVIKRSNRANTTMPDNPKWDGYDLITMVKTLTNAQIARIVGLSEPTVHRKRKKLGI